MSELPDHIQKRLVCLEKSAGTTSARIDKVVKIASGAVDRIDEHIALLERRIDALAKQLGAANQLIEKNQKDYQRLRDSDQRLVDAMYRTGFMVEEDLKSLLERVQHLEFTLFPKAADDALKVKKIIGARPTLRNNPLDRKKS